MYKIGVMGDWDSIYGFSALGLDTFPIGEDEEDRARKILKNASEDGYALVYITEALAARIPDTIDEMKQAMRPAVILIPGISGNTGDGIRAVRDSVVRAVGSDIVFGTGKNE